MIKDRIDFNYKIIIFLKISNFFYKIKVNNSKINNTNILNVQFNFI